VEITRERITAAMLVPEEREPGKHAR
jgi:hypothetical protein